MITTTSCTEHDRNSTEDIIDAIMCRTFPCVYEGVAGAVSTLVGLRADLATKPFNGRRLPLML